MTEITTLDEATISKIAAGEVVERPASVVKELVENSLDADASRIDVSVEGGGTEGIAVADDGIGMTESAARTAIRQHTTSKIRSIADLESGIETLGFRGEALHTIGAVSKMTLRTRPREGADVGTELYVVGGELEDVAPAGRAPGTTVEVADLFFNTPARRKYLKRSETEFAHVNRVVTRYALANADVATSLSHDGREVFSTTGRGDLRETVMSVYGRPVAESMIAVDARPEGPIGSITGYVSDPETTRSGAEYVSTYVNDRYVREGLLREAILEAYGNQLAPDRFPFAVLFLEVPPDTVDVNVHPRKMEVRFDDATAVRDAIEMAVTDALLDHGLVRSGAPRGRSAPADTSIVPEDTGPEGARETGGLEGQRPGASTTEGREAERAAEDRESEGAIEDREANGATGDREVERVTEEHEAEGEPSTEVDRSTVEDGMEESTEGSTAGTGHSTRGTAGDPSDTSAADRPVSTDGTETTDGSPVTGDTAGETGSRIRPSPVQSGLTDREADLEFDTLPPLRILGQVKDTYIVAESPDGLVLIDQHAADERVNYERLAAELADQPTAQRLVDPVELAVTPQEASLLAAAEGELAEMGFDAYREGDTVVVEAVPAVFADTLSPELVRDVLSTFLEAETERDLLESATDALLADMACYPAITGNTSLRDGDVIELLRALEDCENPYACPHGRPVLIELSGTELEDRFERDYPGHATRRPEE